MNLLVDWNNNNNISPGNTAVIQNNTSLTYAQLTGNITKAAFFLRAHGISSGNYVTILSENSKDFLVTVFALWKLGAIPVPLNTRLLSKEIEELIGFVSLNQTKFIITDKVQDIKISDANVISINGYKAEEKIFLSDGMLNFPHLPESDTALIIFTSGSTGKAKGVKLTFNNLIQSAVTGNQFLRQTSDDRWLASLPFYHIGGFSIFVRAFLYGASVIIPESLGLEDITSALKNHKPTIASLVSTQLKRLIAAGAQPNNELSNILLGGGFIDKELILEALKDGWNVSKVYGSSETASFITALNCKEKTKVESAGKAVHPNDIKIVNDKEEVLFPDTPGEIIIKGPSVAVGYLHNPEETNSRFKNGYYYTGDIGYLDEEGYLYIEARRTDLIVTGGENVNPIEVENALLKHPDIAEAAVFAVDDKEWGQTVAAAIVTNNKLQLTTEQIKEFLRDKLAGYKISRKIFIVDELPKSSLGKVQREKLKEMFNKSLER